MRSASSLARGGKLRYHDGQMDGGGASRQGRSRGGRRGGSSVRRGRAGGGRSSSGRAAQATKARGKKRSWRPPEAQPGAHLLVLLSNTDLLPLVLCWLPLWSICRCRRVCREAQQRLDAELSRLRKPVAIGGFSMKEEGYGLGKFLAGAEAFDWVRGRWLDAGALPTRRADHTVVQLDEPPACDDPPSGHAAGGAAPRPSLTTGASSVFLVFGGVNEPSKQAISWADFYSPNRRSSPGAAGPSAAAPSVLPLQHQQLRASS